ncbi:DDE-type integrase/transposase/recombinase [Extibacter muris]|uniref:DDE-type integrase/transposase/recombinase n=1 Tax=Extibacter muris TaxID=1796622 RepID=UPI001D087ECF|nr:DDE-type integrase/transposase/recombinase [Extibacter muris]MCB6202665.1 DDE-type integrase/transposase/recombinase [Extibacter muris]MCQ4663902.1 DDE-type integrase/transposase/recombinase [Extibacter muris]MCQ4693468.1 DDE-type integrase/transposase/recombinase [Extibacter muris]
MIKIKTLILLTWGRKHLISLSIILDDYSRMIVGGKLYYQENAANFQKTLREAVAAYGIPNKLYVDNGSPYSNERIRRPVSREWLEEAFHNRVIRNVNKDATIHLSNERYDAPMQFIGQKVEVSFLPEDPESAYILYGGKHSSLRLTDRVANEKQRGRPCLLILQRRARNMFTDYYGLSYHPFDKQNVKEKDAFRSQTHEQMLSRLDYLKNVRGIGVFTARPGMGKTYALRCFSLILVGEPYLNHIQDKQVHEALRQRVTVH